MNELFFRCCKCNEYKPFYWKRRERNAQDCFDCNPLASRSGLSRILNNPYVRSCNPDLFNQFQEQTRKNAQQYSKTDKVKIATNLRRRINHLVHKGRANNTKHLQDLLGCDAEQLKRHLESQFTPEMSWNNYGNKTGNWSIDHILPLSSFNLFNEEELRKATHYTNLQPLWHIDNLKKGSKLICN